MPPIRFTGPCVQCGQSDPTGYYKKHLCNNCYRKNRRHERGLKQAGFPAKSGPCPVCNRTDLRLIKGMCKNCYKRIEQRKGNTTPRSKYTGPCITCGKTDDSKYFRKMCQSCYKKKTYAEKVKSQKRYCSDCNIEISRLTKTGRCSKCHYRYRYTHDEKYRDHFLESARKYWKTAKGKAKRNGYEHKKRLQKQQTDRFLQPNEWLAVLALYENSCAYCGKELTDSFDCTQDHVIPLSKGGTHSIDNVVPACRVCNARKGDGPPPNPVITLNLVVKDLTVT